jgi:cell division protein FtsB
VRGDLFGVRITIGTLLLAAGIPLGGLFIVAFARVAVADYTIHRQKDALAQEIVSLKRQNDELRARVAYLNSDTGIELLAREDLGWVRSGDTAVVVVIEPTAQLTPTADRSALTVPTIAR